MVGWNEGHKKTWEDKDCNCWKRRLWCDPWSLPHGFCWVKCFDVRHWISSVENHPYQIFLPNLQRQIKAIQNWCYIRKKNLSKHNCQKSWMVKTTTVQKIWMGKTTTIQVFDYMTKYLDGKNHYHPSFYHMTKKLGQ